MPRLRGPRLALACALLPFASACEAGGPGAGSPEDEPPRLGLMGTIPIYWGESETLGDIVGGRGAGHWARERIEARFAIAPLDALTEDSLAGLRRVLLAQPRALSPAENVALDAWVRAGGRLLLFADPMLTGGSRYALGDRRRPQDVVLLSPILDHWGLTLRFDSEGPRDGAVVQAGGMAIPVDLPGVFAAGPGCRIDGGGVLARCRIGEGEVTVLADAALLDLYAPPPGADRALDWLLEQAFPPDGEIAGNTR